MSATSTANGGVSGPVGVVTPPHNLEAEQSVLGAILLSDRSLYALVIEEGLRPEDFYRAHHGTIYAAMLALYNENEPVDMLTVIDRLRQMGKLKDIGGAATVDELTGVVPAAGHARRYAQIVRENALLRRLLKASYEIQESVLGHQAAPRELVEQAEKSMLEVARDDRQQDFRSIEDVLHEEVDKLHRLSLEGTSLTGTPSGFKDLDEITGGFQPGNLIIIAARPAMGKSALVCNIAENAAVEHGKPVALFSLEMAEAELAQRFVASQARIKGEELRKGRVSEQRWPKILGASQRLARAPLWVDDSSDLGMLEIRAKARRLHSQCENGLGLIIVDYLQLMRTDSRWDSRVTAVGELSRGQRLSARAPAGGCPLGVCDGSGFVIDDETDEASDCACRGARIAAARTRALEGRIPRRYLGISFDRPPVTDLARTAPDQVQAVRRYALQIDRNLDAGAGLWIQGDVGTGKTTLAMLVSKAALEAGRSVAIYSLPRLLNLLRESMDSDAGKLDLLDRLTAVDLLHIDDLGAENRTDWVLEQLYSIVNARYEAERAIVATTNLMPDQLSEALGARTVSRLVEICGDLLPLFGEDQRPEFRAEPHA